MSDQHVLHNFTQVLQQLDGGAMVPMLSKQTQDMIAELNDVRADEGGTPKGKITITLDYKLDGDTIEVVPTVKVEKPKRAMHKSTFWTTEGNKLTLANPKQQQMDLHDIGGARRTHDA